MSAAARSFPAPVSATPASSLTPTEVVQFLAHDLRQPLSTIEAIAFYLDLILPREDDRTREQVAKLHTLLEQFHWMLNNGVHAATPICPAPAALDLNEVVSQVLSAQGMDVDVHLESESLVARLDAAQTLHAVENALLLMRGIAGAHGSTRLETFRDGEFVALLIRVSLPSAWSGALPPGKTLSLACLRRFVESHQGQLSFRPEDEDGPVLAILLPAV